MEVEHTPTIIQLILSTDLVIQLKDSHLILHISQQNDRLIMSAKGIPSASRHLV